MRPSADFHGLLAALNEAEVEFIVVGGVGAVLRGAPITTLDLDVVHNRTAANVDRLLQKLAELKAQYRTHPHVPLQSEVLLGPGHIRLMTTLGPLDLLGQIGAGLDYASLLDQSTDLDVGGFAVQVLRLSTLIQIKESVGRDKDRAILPLLRRTLEEVGDDEG